MRNNHDKSRILTLGVWLIGLGLLFETGLWWPGILFLGAAAALIQAWSAYGPEDRRTMTRVGVTLALIGFWALVRFSVAFLLVGLGVWVVVSALRTPALSQKPYIDRRLD